MMNKKRITPAILLLFLWASGLYARGQLLEKKTFASPLRRNSKIILAKLFVDNDNEIFIRINDFLYVNKDWIDTKKYGRRLNGFLEDGRLYMAFEKDENIDIYEVKKDLELARRIKIIKRGGGFERIFAVGGEDNSYFLLCMRGQGVFGDNPFGLIMAILSGGHGTTYWKPVLAEVRDDEIRRYLKVRYGGKSDESFYIKKAVIGEKSIGFLGFRKLEEYFQPVILHYADYDLEKRKVMRSHAIYENTPRYDKETGTRFDYGSISMDNFGDDFFIVFSRFSSSQNPRRRLDLKNFESDIYYWQCSDGNFGDIEKIAEGFSPIVRADSLGNVHVIWVDGEGAFFHKVRKDDKWSEEEIILRDADMCKNVVYGKNISAEFDKDNNLNIVYSSDEDDVIYAKVRLE